jgi:DNA-binding CsgD family transcriptional regulator
MGRTHSRGGRISPRGTNDLRPVTRALRLTVGGCGVLAALVTGSVAIGAAIEMAGDASRRGATQWSVLVFFIAIAIVGAALGRWAFGRPRPEDDGDAERDVLATVSREGGAASELAILMQTSLSAGRVRAAIQRLTALGLLEPSADGTAFALGRSAATGTSAPEPSGATPSLRQVEAVAARYGLTPAEAQVLEQVAGGLSNDEAGQRLFISPATVRTHLSSIFRKLGVRSRVQAALVVTRGIDLRDDSGAE